MKRTIDTGFISNILMPIKELAAYVVLGIRKELAWRRIQRGLKEIENGEFADINSLKDLR